MNKHFAKVTKTYSTKNKLQLYILKELELIDRFLFASKEEAGNYINNMYSIAIESYNGTAAVPELKKHEPDENQVVYYVEDVIFLSIFTVKTDLS